MNSVPNLNAIPDTSPAKLKIAEAHAVACWVALEKHVRGFRGIPLRCGCALGGVQGGYIVIRKGCDVGEACKEEYEIASRRVREIQAAQGLEFGDFESAVTP